MAASLIVTPTGVFGAPVPCVSLLSSSTSASSNSDDWCLLYGQGPFLHRLWLNHPPHKFSAEERMLVLEQGSIHGIRHAPTDSGSPFSVVFGGRLVAFVHHVVEQTNDPQPMRVLFVQQRQDDESALSPYNKYLRLSDWVWDCQVIASSNDSPDATASDSNHHHEFLLLVGLAHNTVQVLRTAVSSSSSSGNDDDHRLGPSSLSIQTRLERIVHGTTRSISYSVNLHGTTGQVAVGTVSNEILVWSLHNSKASNKNRLLLENTAKPLQHDKDCVEREEIIVTDCHHLTGHLGVLHAVRFDPNGLRLASTSDDRSVRLWEKKLDDSSDEWCLRWTAWGHSARGFAVAFCSSFTVMGAVLSAGEDSTLRIWDAGTGAALAVVLNHNFQWIRSIDTICDKDGKVWAVAGGNNGTVALYNLSDRVVQRRSFEAKVQQQEGRKCNTSWTASFRIPSDWEKAVIDSAAGPDNACTSEPPRAKKKKKRRNKPLQQVVVGMEFCSTSAVAADDDNNSNNNEPCLLVATRAGSIMLLDSRDGRWTQQKPWRTRTNEGLTDGVSLEGCCIKIHPRYPVAAIGTTRGDIVLTDIGSRRDESGEVARHTVLAASQQRAVQRLQWVEDTILLSFHLRTVVMWTFHSVKAVSSACVGDNEYEACVLQSGGTKGTTSCGALNLKTKQLVVGDTRGNLSLFDLRSVNASETLHPTYFQRFAHGKKHVNSIVWNDDDIVVSVGNDGCLLESIVDKEGNLTSLLSVSVGTFTGLDHLWNRPGKQNFSSKLVGGYIGNTYAIVDVASGYEYFSVDTGGRQRLLSVCDLGIETDPSAFPRSCRVAVCESRKEGGNDIVLIVRGVGGRGHCDEKNHFAQPDLTTGGLNLHAESIFDACCFPIDSKGHTLALLTASEDCSSRISVYESGRLVISKLLPSQSSGVRAVCCSRAGPGSTLIGVGGAKAETQFFLLRDLSGESIPMVLFIGRGRTSEKRLLDQRINAIRAIPIPTTKSGDNRAHIFITGDSSGNCCSYRISEEGKNQLIGTTFFRSDRPILSLELVRHDGALFVFVGATDGLVLLFDLTEIEDCHHTHQSAFLKPLLSLDNHSVGTNAIAARVVTGDNEAPVIRICTVGDDQSIACCDLHMDGEMSLSVRNKCSKYGASLSALKGVQWIGDESFATAGYDQRLVLWQWYNKSSIELITACPIGIGDVNCLASCSFGSSRLFAVGGAGVEILTLTTHPTEETDDYSHRIL